jgi:hypothetical protein
MKTKKWATSSGVAKRSIGAYSRATVKVRFPISTFFGCQLFGGFDPIRSEHQPGIDRVHANVIFNEFVRECLRKTLTQHLASGSHLVTPLSHRRFETTDSRIMPHRKHFAKNLENWRLTTGTGKSRFTHHHQADYERESVGSRGILQR